MKTAINQKLKVIKIKYHNKSNFFEITLLVIKINKGIVKI